MNTFQDKRRIFFPLDGMRDATHLLAASRGIFISNAAQTYITGVKVNDGLHIPHCGPDILE